MAHTLSSILPSFVPLPYLLKVLLRLGLTGPTLDQAHENIHALSHVLWPIPSTCDLPMYMQHLPHVTLQSQLTDR